MKKGRKVLLSCLGGGIVLIGVIAVWQWNNIEAVIKWRSYSQEELANQISEQKEQVKDALEDYGISGIEDFTFEEEEAIRKGELSVEDAIRKYEALEVEDMEVMHEMPAEVMDDTKEGEKEKRQNQKEEVVENMNTTKQKKAATKKADEGNQQSGSLNLTESKYKEQEESKEIVEAAVAKMYALKAKYIAALGQLEQSARQEYIALSQEEKNKDGAATIISQYMGTAISLQGACDSEVAGVLGTLRQELKSRGESTEIVDTMQATYEQEKSLKKAYYLSLLN